MSTSRNALSWSYQKRLTALQCLLVSTNPTVQQNTKQNRSLLLLENNPFRKDKIHRNLQSLDSLLLQGSALALIFRSSELPRSVWLPTIFHICITVHFYNPPLHKIPWQYCNLKWKANIVCWMKALQQILPAAGCHLAMRQHLSASGAAQWDSLAMQGMHMLSPSAFFFVKVTATVALWARGHSRKTTLLLTSMYLLRGDQQLWDQPSDCTPSTQDRKLKSESQSDPQQTSLRMEAEIWTPPSQLPQSKGLPPASFRLLTHIQWQKTCAL